MWFAVIKDDGFKAYKTYKTEIKQEFRGRLLEVSASLH